MNDQELRNPANWKMDEAVLHEPVKAPRSVVSVSFGQDDLAAVAKAARERGMKTSEFIRNAAVMEANRTRRRRFDVFSGGASQGVTTVLSMNWRRGATARMVVRKVIGSTGSGTLPK